MKRINLKLILALSLFSLALAVFLPGYISSVQSSRSSKLIEVCKDGPVYVPPGTKFVKCHGKILRVVKIERFDPGKSDCLCPKCCEGNCGIIISCSPAPKPNLSLKQIKAMCAAGAPMSAFEDLCMLWAAC